MRYNKLQLMAFGKVDLGLITIYESAVIRLLV